MGPPVVRERGSRTQSWRWRILWERELRFTGDSMSDSVATSKMGNIVSHASSKEVTIWDAELLEALFWMILEYVYLGPARVKQLKEGMSG